MTPLFDTFSDKADGAIIQSFYDAQGNLVGVLKVTEGESFTVGDNSKITEEMLDDDENVMNY